MCLFVSYPDAKAAPAQPPERNGANRLEAATRAGERRQARERAAQLSPVQPSTLTGPSTALPAQTCFPVPIPLCCSLHL